MSELICYDSNGNELKHFYQWDSDRTIEIDVSSLDASSLELHFGNRLCDQAFVMETTVSSGTASAEVPNVLLQNAETLIVYLYEPDGDYGGRTLETIFIPVIPRSKPGDYMYTNNVPEFVRTITGKSAYEIAVMHGYSGTEEQWLELLQGGWQDITNGYLDSGMSAQNFAKAINVNGRWTFNDDNEKYYVFVRHGNRNGDVGSGVKFTLFLHLSDDIMSNVELFEDGDSHGGIYIDGVNHKVSVYGLAYPAGDSYAANKKYVDDQIDAATQDMIVSGSSFTAGDIGTKSVTIDSYSLSSEPQYGAVKIETSDTPHSGTAQVNLTATSDASVSARGVRITGVAEPNSDGDAANKKYVDDQIDAVSLKAVIWFLSSMPASTTGGRHVTSISSMIGPTGAEPAPGQLLLTRDNSTLRAFYIEEIDNNAVILINII